MTAPVITAAPGYGSPTGVAGTTASRAPTVDPGRKKSWLELTHPDYDSLYPKWLFAWEHYTGLVLDPNRITDYLPRKVQAETENAYAERTGLADYTPHYANC